MRVAVGAGIFSGDIGETAGVNHRMIQSRIKYGAVIVRTAVDRDFSKGIIPERGSLLAVEGEIAVAGKLGFIVGLSTLHADKRYGCAERYAVTFFRRKFGKEPEMIALVCLYASHHLGCGRTLRELPGGDRLQMTVGTGGHHCRPHSIVSHRA